MKGYGVGVSDGTGEEVEVGVSVEVGGTGVLVAGSGVFVGFATTMETVNVEPNGLPDCVPSLQLPVYVPGCLGAVN